MYQAQQFFGFDDPRQVWTDSQTLGVVSDNMLMSIEKIAHEDVYGTVMEWHLTVNAPQTPIDSPVNISTEIANPNTGV